jgi:hypothetical protein
MLKITTADPTIDIAGQYSFALDESPRWGTTLKLDLANTTNNKSPNSGYFVQHAHAGIEASLNGEVLESVSTASNAQIEKALHFSLKNKEFKEGDIISLRFHAPYNAQPIAEVEVGPGGMLIPTENHAIYQMGSHETRPLGRPLKREAVKARFPYSRELRKDFKPELHTPITDVHTHYSAQLSGQDLLQVAIEADQKAVDAGGEPIAYPVELFELLGVPRVVDQPTVDMKGLDFHPMKRELACERGGEICQGVRVTELTQQQRAAIIRKMDIPGDMTMGFSNFDREMYRFRNPFVKHADLAKAIIKKIAEDYAAQGVEYAELSTGAMLDPNWFRAMTEAVAEIERDGVGPDHKKPKLRFLVGLPRNANPKDTLVAIEKIKHLAAHPYILGVDLLGYESNKTGDFHWALAHLAQWVKASGLAEHFILRTHAGETEKNKANVSEKIQMLHDYGVRGRIGHARYHDTDTNNKVRVQLTALNADPEKDLFATERCMSANQAYRTVMFVHDQPKMVAGARFLGSDGGGALRINNRELAYAALAAGWTMKDLADLRVFEQGYIERQAVRETEKTTLFEKRYGKDKEGFEAFLKGYKAVVEDLKNSTAKPVVPNDAELAAKDPKYAAALEYMKAHRPAVKPVADEDQGLPAAFDGKRPILIGGASGNSWAGMDELDKKTVAQCMELLVRTMDPQKCYFVLGRVQKEGVSKALDRAIGEWNAEHPENPFLVLGRYAGASEFPTGELAENISWLHNIESVDKVPASQLAFTKKHKGLALMFDGSDFTAEMTYGAEDEHIPCAVQEPKKGRMARVAQDVRSDSVFSALDGFVNQVLEGVGEDHLFRTRKDKDSVLREGIDLAAVKAEVEALKLGRDGKQMHKKNWTLHSNVVVPPGETFTSLGKNNLH